MNTALIHHLLSGFLRRGSKRESRAQSLQWLGALSARPWCSPPVELNIDFYTCYAMSTSTRPFKRRELHPRRTTTGPPHFSLAFFFPPPPHSISSRPLPLAGPPRGPTCRACRVVRPRVVSCDRVSCRVAICVDACVRPKACCPGSLHGIGSGAGAGDAIFAECVDRI